MKNKSFAKITSLLLSVFMLSASLIACENYGVSSDTDLEESTAESSTEKQTEDSLIDTTDSECEEVTSDTEANTEETEVVTDEK